MPGFPPNFFIEYFSLQTSAKIIHRQSAISQKKPKEPKRATVPQLCLTKPLLSKLKLLKILLLALPFSFSQYLGLCVLFTLLPVIKLIKDHWHGSRHISVMGNPGLGQQPPVQLPPQDNSPPVNCPPSPNFFISFYIYFLNEK